MVRLSGMELPCAAHGRDLVAVHDALLAFEPIDARAAKVVELRFFGGLEDEEIADALSVSLARPVVRVDVAGGAVSY